MSMSCDRNSEEKLVLTDSARTQNAINDPIRDNFAGRLLRNFLNVMNSFGDDAQEVYEEKLKELKKHAEDIMVEVVRAEGAADESDYPFRWALVHTASELKSPASLRFLKNLVFSPIPPEKSKDPHSFSTVAEETILRTTAVEGIENLAKMGNEEAQKTLFNFLELPSISIKRAAIQAIFATVSDEKKLEKMRSLMPREHHYLLEIKRVNVKDVPQIKEPQKDLKEGATDTKKEPPKMPEKQECEKPPKTYRSD